MKKKKILQKMIFSRKNIYFSDVLQIVKALGFTLDRINGSHHIFKHPEIPELINLQNVKGKAKPYQIKQLLDLIEEYDLSLEDEK